MTENGIFNMLLSTDCICVPFTVVEMTQTKAMMQQTFLKVETIEFAVFAFERRLFAYKCEIQYLL